MLTFRIHNPGRFSIAKSIAKSKVLASSLSPGGGAYNRALKAENSRRVGVGVGGQWYNAKTKALISFPVTAKLVCAFVLAYANCWFSDAVAPLVFT